MAYHVISCLDGRWDDNLPRVVVGDQDVGAPVAVYDGRINQADLVDLEPLECSLINGLAWTIAICQVADHWPVVTNRPLCPLKFHNSTALDGCLDLCVGSSYMADNIWRGIERWVHEAVAEVLGRKPAHRYRRRADILIFGTIAFIATLYQLMLIIFIRKTYKIPSATIPVTYPWAMTLVTKPRMAIFDHIVNNGQSLIRAR